jgi:hypothetical protein
MNSRVEVAIVWRDSQGREQRREAYTRLVSSCGCLVVLPENLALEQPLEITNLASQQAARAIVVWKGNERAEGWELGIELVNAETDFWGLDL